MLMNGTNGNEPGYPEKALVPYPVILAATKGDPEAVAAVLSHYAGYIRSCAKMDGQINTDSYFTRQK